MSSHISIAKQAENLKTQIEGDRILPAEIINKVKAEGLVKKWATHSMGGEEAKVSEVSKMLSDIAYHNGSLAWVTGVTGCSSLLTGYITESEAEPFFKDEKAMVGGFAGPAGKATLVEGGVHISGNWSWGSGINHCSHIIGGAFLMKDEAVVGTIVAFFDPQEVEILDNWHVVGLKGTRSVDYRVKNLFIPNGRWFAFPVKESISDSPLYRFSFLGALSSAVASVGLGLAKRALDELEDLAMVKKPFGQGKPLSKRPIFQSEIAKLKAQYESCSTYMYHVITEAENECENGPCSKATKGRIRMATAHAAQTCHAVVQGAFDLAGGSSIWQNNKLEELIRDMNVVKQHGMVNALNFRTVGAVVLGEAVPEVAL